MSQANQDEIPGPVPKVAIVPYFVFKRREMTPKDLVKLVCMVMVLMGLLFVCWNHLYHRVTTTKTEEVDESQDIALSNTGLCVPLFDALHLSNKNRFLLRNPKTGEPLVSCNLTESSDELRRCLRDNANQKAVDDITSNIQKLQIQLQFRSLLDYSQVIEKVTLFMNKFTYGNETYWHRDLTSDDITDFAYVSFKTKIAAKNICYWSVIREDKARVSKFHLWHQTRPGVGLAIGLVKNVTDGFRLMLLEFGR